MWVIASLLYNKDDSYYYLKLTKERGRVKKLYADVWHHSKRRSKQICMQLANGWREEASNNTTKCTIQITNLDGTIIRMITKCTKVLPKLMYFIQTTKPSKLENSKYNSTIMQKRKSSTWTWILAYSHKWEIQLSLTKLIICILHSTPYRSNLFYWLTIKSYLFY